MGSASSCQHEIPTAIRRFDVIELACLRKIAASQTKKQIIEKLGSLETEVMKIACSIDGCHIDEHEAVFTGLVD